MKLGIAVVFCLLMALSGQAQKPAQGVTVSGRLINSKGQPLGATEMRLVGLSAGSTYTLIALPRHDGVFSFPSVTPGRYQFLVSSPQFKTNPPTVDVGAEHAVELGAVTVAPDFQIRLRESQILVDAVMLDRRQRERSADSGTLREGLPELTTKSDAPDPPLCQTCLDHHYQTVEAFLGEKVKRVRVTDTFDSQGKAVDPDEVRSRVLDLWAGVFQHLSGFRGWSEGTIWDLQASVEYEDGDVALVLTDGHHVEIQDRNGKVWYIRLWPAVD